MVTKTYLTSYLCDSSDGSDSSDSSDNCFHRKTFFTKTFFTKILGSAKKNLQKHCSPKTSFNKKLFLKTPFSLFFFLIIKNFFFTKNLLVSFYKKNDLQKKTQIKLVTKLKN